jgi:hypothetical protein
MKFVSDILTTSLKAVLKDPEVQDFLIRAARELLDSTITEKVLPLIPVAIGSAVKAFTESMPGVESIQSAFEASEQVRQDLNRAIPDIDLGIPLIDNLMDIWRPKA